MHVAHVFAAPPAKRLRQRGRCYRNIHREDMEAQPNKGSNAQFYPNLWNNNEEEMKKSLDKLYNQKSTFTLNFEGTELDGELMGTTVNGQGINSSVNGTWKADGASGSLSISVKVTGAAESDALAKAFISGLQNVYKYEGDANSLTLYFKDGPTTRVMGFTPQR